MALRKEVSQDYSNQLKEVVGATSTNDILYQLLMLSRAVTMPSFEAQAALIKHVYESNGLDYDSTQYVEAHVSQLCYMQNAAIAKHNLRALVPRSAIRLR